MKNFFEFLYDYLDKESHISSEGFRVTIHETDPSTKLPDVDICIPNNNNLFAFIMDRKGKKICDQRKHGCQKRQDKANALNSKICTLLETKCGMHVGCDGIIVAEENGQIKFYVCELKSESCSGVGTKFTMARALIIYLCEAAKAAKIIIPQVSIYFFLFKIIKGKKTGTNVSSTIQAQQTNPNFPHMVFQIPSSCDKQFRVVDVTKHMLQPHTWSIQP